MLLLLLLSYWYGWLCCVLRPPSGQKQTKTSNFKINPYHVRCFVGNLGYQKRQKQRINLLPISIFAALSVIIRDLQSAQVLTLCSWYISIVALLCVPSSYVALWLCLLSCFAIYALVSRFKGVLTRFECLVWVCIGCVLVCLK